MTKLEGTSSSKNPKPTAMAKKANAPAMKGSSKDKQKAHEEDTAGKDGESAAEFDDYPFDPPSSDKSRPPSLPRRRWPKRAKSPRCRRHEDDEEDRLPTRILKIDFPLFDRSDDPLIWLNRYELYFRGNKTPKHRRVWMASLYMTVAAQSWYYKYEMNNDEPSWRMFVRLAQKRFGPSMIDTPMRSLALLRHTRTIDDYCNKFMQLSCRDGELSEWQQIHLFPTNLQEPIKTDIALHLPRTMDDAVMFARAYEQRQPPPTRSPWRASYRSALPPPAPGPSSSATAVQASSTPAGGIPSTMGATLVPAYTRQDGPAHGWAVVLLRRQIRTRSQVQEALSDGACHRSRPG